MWNLDLVIFKGPYVLVWVPLKTEHESWLDAGNLGVGVGEVISGSGESETGK